MHLTIPGSGGWFGSRMTGNQNRLLTPGKQKNEQGTFSRDSDLRLVLRLRD
jgi:hypothetical protein